MLGDAFEVREAASTVGSAGERLDDGPANRRQGAGHSLANPMLLAAFLTSKASLSIQNPDLGVDIAKIRNLGLCQPASKMRVQQFAIREDTIFLYCRVQKWAGGGVQQGYAYIIKENNSKSKPEKKSFATSQTWQKQQKVT